MLTVRTLGRSILATAGVVALMAAAPPRATFWHTHLEKSDPAANDTLKVAPKTIRLWFSEAVDLPVTRVKLETAAGVVVKTAAPVRPDTGESAPISVAIGAPLAAGSYKVDWSTAGKDGHPAKGSFAFVVKGH
jgi:hypothetical protein